MGDNTGRVTTCARASIGNCEMSQINLGQSPPGQQGKSRSKLPLILIFVLSLAPVLAAVLVYFNPSLRPASSVAYGMLIDPQRPVPAPASLALTTIDGQPFDLATLNGKWVLATADSGDCSDDCAKKLFIWRNAHASQGKEVERLKRIWFITDDAPVPQKVLDAYKGTIMVRVKPEQLAAFLYPQDGKNPVNKGLNNFLWMIDPLGNLFIQYPEDADPSKIRDELRKLLSNSRIG